MVVVVVVVGWHVLVRINVVAEAVVLEVAVMQLFVLVIVQRLLKT